MNKLVCKHCKTELTLNNIKDIEFGRICEMTELGEMDKEVAYIKCSKCGNITETDNETGHSLRTNLINMWRMYHYDILYNFRDIEDLLNNLSDSDKERIKDYQFKVFEDCTDDDSGDVYYYITIFKDDTEIGKITMYCNSSTTWDLETNNEIKYGEPSYSYTMELNKEQSSNEKDYIECPKCHNKILGNYWLNIKYQGHNNYGDYEEDIYTGECPICSETIETSELELYTNSLEAEETELQQYYKVIGNFGYDSSPFEDCDYYETCAADELKYIKNALDNLNDILNVKYINNIDILLAEQSGKLLDRHSYVITNIFCNTKYYNFKPESINDCKFRILPDIINVHCEAESEEEFDFSTPITTKLMQVWRNNKIIGYIVLSQQYPLELDFRMNVINRASPDGYKTLCDYYSRIYKI